MRYLPVALALCTIASCKCSSRSAARKGDYETSLWYQPDRCSYSVSVPLDVEAERAGDAAGSHGKPDHVHASFAGPAASSFVVNWRTELADKATRILFGTDREKVARAEAAGNGVELRDGHTMVYASSADGERKTRVHEVHVCGLQPATRYFYKVGSAGAFSEVYDIVTAPPVGPTASARFAVLGDTRQGSAVFAQIQQRIRDAGARFQLHTGDFVTTGTVQSEWDAMFEAQAPNGKSATDTLARVPLMPVNGNHEALAPGYIAQFAVPQQLSDGELHPEQWYSFDYGNVHVVVLDDWVEPSVMNGPERSFLEQDLEAVDRARTPWLFVVTHQPLYSCSKRGSNVKLRRAWQPLFDRYGVDIVFQGHEHNYERSLPIRGFRGDSFDGEVASRGEDDGPVDGSGTVYVVAGGGGAPLYEVSTRCYHTKTAVSAFSYVVVDTRGLTLQLRAHGLDGSVIDSFETKKRSR